MTVVPSETHLSILVVTAMYPQAERPGYGAFVMHQVEYLRSLGHSVCVLDIRGYRSRWNYLGGAVRVFWTTWRHRYDVVHAHYGLTGLCALFRWRTPVVITLHGSDVLRGKFQRMLSRLASRLASGTIAVSPEIASRCSGVVIPCGVDLRVFQPLDRGAARRELGLSADEKIVLFPFESGREVKRYDIAARALEVLQLRGVKASIVSVSAVPNGRMPLYYSAADVMLLCSDTEGSPTSVKEALACNLPVVSTDVGDVRSIMEGIAGTEICAQTPESIAAALERVLTRPAHVVFNGRAAMDRYDQASVVGSIVDVYEAVMRHEVCVATLALSRSRGRCP